MYKKIKNFIETFIIIFLVILLGITKVPNLFGIESRIALSGSMEPEIHTGALVYVDKDFNSDDIYVGNIIAFKINDGTPVIHRIASVDEENQEVMTKGDANENEDFAPVPYENIIGVLKWNIPYIGYPIYYITNGVHWLVTTMKGWVTLAIFILAIYGLNQIFSKETEEKVNGKQ